MAEETFRIIEEYVKEWETDPAPFINRFKNGIESYRRPDGSHNHLQPSFNTALEAIQEAVDAVNLTSCDERRGDMSENMKTAREYFMMGYCLLLAILEEQGTDISLIWSKKSGR